MNTAFSDLAHQLRGAVLEPPPAEYFRDFGNHRFQKPRAVVVPESVEDVQATLAFANRLGLRVAVRVDAGSNDGQTLCDSLVLQTKHLNRINLDAPGCLNAGAGCEW